MKNKIMLFLAFILLSSELSARCNGSYADDILATAFTCLKSPDSVWAIVGLDSIHREAADEVMKICMDGCYGSFMRTPEDHAICRARYATVIKNHFATIKSAIMKGVSDRFKQNSPVIKCSEEQVKEEAILEVINARPERKNCNYIANSEVISRITPEKILEEDAKLCGTPATVKCAAKTFTRCDAMAVCQDAFVLNGHSYRGSTYKVYCIAKDGSCPADVLDCLADETIDQSDALYREKNFKYKYNADESPGIEINPR